MLCVCRDVCQGDEEREFKQEDTNSREGIWNLLEDAKVGVRSGIRCRGESRSDKQNANDASEKTDES